GARAAGGGESRAARGGGDRPPGRGPEDVSHLFFPQPPPGPERPSPPPAARGGVALLRAASVSKERLAAVVKDFAGALEDGLKPIRSEERRVGKEGRSRWGGYQ